MDLQRIWAVLVGRRRIVAACCAVCIVLALAYGAIAPKRYLATAYLLTGGSNGSARGASSPSRLEIATNPRVIRRALQQLDATPLPEDIVERLEKSVARNLAVEQQRDSDVVGVRFAADDPRVASATANAVANAYLEISDELRHEPLKRDLAAMQGQLRLLQAQADEARTELVALRSRSGIGMADEGMDAEPPPIEAERRQTMLPGGSGDRERVVVLERNADDAGRLLRLMRERLDRMQLDGARGGDGGIVLAAARPPHDPVSPAVAELLPLAALFGLCVGASFVLAWERLAPRVRRPDDLVVHTGVEVLTSVPMTKHHVARAVEQVAGPFLDHRRLSALSAASRPIGNLLVAFGAMSRLDAESVVDMQRESGTPFGRTAVAMGLISDVQLRKALSVQYGRPRMTFTRRSPSAALVVDQEPDHPVASALRALRSQLLLRPPGQRPAVITISSVDPKDGRTFVATNLAIAFAQIGKRVLLVDANLRSPALHNLFELSNERGLSGYLARRHGAPKIHDVGTRGSFGVMLAGPVPPNPEELLSSHQLGLLLHSLRSVFEVIVIDTPATSIGADAHLLSARAGSTLMVGRLHVTGLDAIGRLTRKFTQQDVQIIGTVVNEA